MDILCHKVWGVSQGHRISELKRISYASPLFYRWGAETQKDWKYYHLAADLWYPHRRASPLSNISSPLPFVLIIHLKILWHSINYYSSQLRGNCKIHIYHLRMIKSFRCHGLYFLNSFISKSIITVCHHRKYKIHLLEGHTAQHVSNLSPGTLGRQKLWQFIPSIPEEPVHSVPAFHWLAS